jgi:hypothetical protein
MGTYIKSANRLTVKFVQESTNEIILEVPSTALELHDFFKPDYVTSIIRNTFGEDKMKKIGNVTLVVDVQYIFKA